MKIFCDSMRSAKDFKVRNEEEGFEKGFESKVVKLRLSVRL